jgi:NADH-quinone oxidoreductase subunit L
MPEPTTYTAAIQELLRVKGLWLIPFFPALGAFINLIFGSLLQKKLGKRAISVVAVGSMVLSSLTALYFFCFRLIPLEPGQRFLLDEVFPMIDIGAVRVNMAFAMDPLGGVMATMVTVVATAIHIYSTGYMASEPSYWRYFGYLNLFCFSMLLLVLGDNFILMFFGWEGVGLCSYLLIGFWFKDRQKAAAGMKAFVVNRIGDFGFIVGMFTLFWGLLGVWDAAPGKMTAVSDGRCVTVETVPLPLHHGGAHGGAPGEHQTPEAGGMKHGHGSLGIALLGTAHAQAHGSKLSAPQQAMLNTITHGLMDRSGEQRGRCGIQPAVAVGRTQQLYLGPTVSFREIKDQLSVEDPRIEDPWKRRVVAWHLAGGTLLGIGILVIATFGFFIGATGKSAQIPLYVWLPDAMAGPTPVSALIHAATMVTAGVYMVARLNFIFILCPEGMTLVATVGALTALFAATIGFFQNDIKKVLAYSTVSQLGYMFVGVGVGAYWVGIYHLLTHAFFKACLFLGSGSVIHGMHWVEHRHGHGHDAPAHGHEEKKRDLRLEPDPCDPQDMRNMGGLGALMPHTRTTYLIACLAIAGIPGFSGFFSKDEILWKAFSTGNLLISGKLIWALGAVGALCTAFYMFRSFFMTFYGRKATEEHVHHVHESPRSMTWVLWFLAGGAVLTGVLGLPLLWTGREPLFEQFMAPSVALSSVFQRPATAHGHGLEWGLMGLSVALALGGIAAAFLLYYNIAKREAKMAALREKFHFIHVLVFNKYFVDEIYQATVIRGTVLLTRALAWFDLRIVDGLVNASGWGLRMLAAVGGAIDSAIVDGAVNGVADSIIGAGRRMRRVQTGRVNTYVMGVAFGVVVLLFVVWFVTPLGGK